jgi:hypothetical protein
VEVAVEIEVRARYRDTITLLMNRCPAASSTTMYGPFGSPFVLN